jgi:hypothetical protein
MLPSPSLDPVELDAGAPVGLTLNSRFDVPGPVRRLDASPGSRIYATP